VRKNVLPKVSVVIPSYQAGRFIREAVDSVLHQSYKDYEIIIVDDGSTDNTKEVLASYGDRIKVLNQNNMGVSAARNKGIMSSRGEYIAFLDADDLWLPDKLERQVTLLEEHPEIGLVFSDMWVVGETDVPARDRPFLGKSAFQIGKPSKGKVFKHLFLNDFIPMPTAMVRRRCFEKVGLFDSAYDSCEDYDLWLRLSQHFSIDYVDKPLAIYRMHGGSLIHDLEKHFGCLISLRKRALRENPSLLREFDPDTMDRVYYRFHVYLGMIQMSKGDQKGARENYHEYIRLNPHDPRIYSLLLATFLPARLVSRLMVLAQRLSPV